MTVKRFTPRKTPYAEMIALPDGEYVRHDDYAKVVAHNEYLLARLKKSDAQLAAIKADRQQRGEPVAVIRFERNKPGNENEMPRVISCNRLPDGDYQVFLVPQPAVPAQKPFMYLRTLNGKPDWGDDCVADCESDLIHDEEMYAEGYGVMPLYTAPQHAAAMEQQK